jgi:alpha-tubulin suppressor-like RCC1 family protein
VVRSVVKCVLLLSAALTTLACVATTASAVIPPVQVTAGGEFACGVTAAGAVKCWGSDNYGQLGDGVQLDPEGDPLYISRQTPVLVRGLSDIKMVAAGTWQACALSNGGSVSCWGSNFSGQLGDGTTTPRTTPVAVSGLSSGIKTIAAGSDSTCAVTNAGGVKCWGSNNYGQLGDGTTDDSSVPVDVSGLTSGVDAVTVGDGHSCALMDTGGVKCWGTDGAGTSLTPLDVPGLDSGVKALASGWYHACALRNDGSDWCWGQMPNAAGYFDYLSPPGTPFLTSGIKAIGAGSYTTCAVTTGGGGKCWGNDYVGQAGDGGGGFRSNPVDVIGLSNAETVAVGDFYACALLDTREINCWGSRGFNLNDPPPSVAPANLAWGGQTIDFPKPLDRNFGHDFTTKVYASSGLGVSLRSAGPCAVHGLVLHMTGLGTCTLTASQSGSDDFVAAPDVSRSFVIRRGVRVRITRIPGKVPKNGVRHPKLRHRWVLQFEDPAATKFFCSLDGMPFHQCFPGVTYHGLKAGFHVFRVKSADAEGNESAVKKARFRVRG